MIHGSVGAISIKVVSIKISCANSRHTFWAHVFRAMCNSRPFYFQKLELYRIISHANLALPRKTTRELDKQVEREFAYNVIINNAGRPGYIIQFM